MITTVMLVQQFATKTLYTRARATDGSTMLAPMSLGAGKGLNLQIGCHGQAGVTRPVCPRPHIAGAGTGHGDEVCAAV